MMPNAWSADWSQPTGRSLACSVSPLFFITARQTCGWCRSRYMLLCCAQWLCMMINSSSMRWTKPSLVPAWESSLLSLTGMPMWKSSWMWVLLGIMWDRWWIRICPFRGGSGVERGKFWVGNRMKSTPCLKPIILCDIAKLLCACSNTNYLEHYRNIIEFIINKFYEKTRSFSDKLSNVMFSVPTKNYLTLQLFPFFLLFSWPLIQIIKCTIFIGKYSTLFLTMAMDSIIFCHKSFLIFFFLFYLFFVQIQNVYVLWASFSGFVSDEIIVEIHFT